MLTVIITMLTTRLVGGIALTAYLWYLIPVLATAYKNESMRNCPKCKGQPLRNSKRRGLIELHLLGVIVLRPFRCEAASIVSISIAGLSEICVRRRHLPAVLWSWSRGNKRWNPGKKFKYRKTKGGQHDTDCIVDSLRGR